MFILTHCIISYGAGVLSSKIFFGTTSCSLFDLYSHAKMDRLKMRSPSRFYIVHDTELELYFSRDEYLINYSSATCRHTQFLILEGGHPKRAGVAPAHDGL